ncbi:MAG: hypothetical protein HY928_00235 [Elusimicrobia bacterium]|nr:hypothetical protein [Elusimicrobiota bacterium]
MPNGLAIFLEILFLALPCAAGTAQSITVQGRLIDPTSGTPRDDPAADFVFRLFDASSGGAPLWAEGPTTLPLQGGVFEASIGLSVPLSSAVFAGAERWLEIQVEATVLSPRQRLSAVPWVQRAGAAESLEPGSTEYIQTRDSLQAGATFYVSSASVAGQLTTYGELRAAADLRVDGILRGVNGLPLTTAAGNLDASALDPSTLVPNSALDNSSVTKLGNAFQGPNGLLLLDPSARVPDAHLDGAAVTKQGNTFNSANQLVLLNGSGFVPNNLVDGSSVAKRGATGYIPNTLLDSSSVTLMGNTFNGPNNLLRLSGAGLIQNADIDGSSVTKLNSYGYVPNTFLDSSSVTLQANIFNAANRLASLDGSATLNLPASGDFVYSLVTSTSINVTGTGAKVRENGVDIVPKDAILMRIGPCPAGYTEYTLLRGRLPVGNCSGCTVGSTAGTAFTVNAQGLTHNHTGSVGTGGTGNTGGTLNSADTQDTTNPYLQLTFCQKN